MAKEKQMNSRIQMKHDTEANWIIAGNATKPFIPKQGEIIIYDIDSTYNYERMKIGDGLTGINNLPFVAEANGSAYDAAENGGLIKNENNEFAIDDTITFFFVGGTAADIANALMTERLEGDGQEFYTAAPSTLSFRSTAPLNELQDIQINGETVEPTNYELEEGSTIVKLKHNYLGTLNVGSYELAVISDNKIAKGNFTVAAPGLNEYGFYYDQFYYIEWLDLGGNYTGEMAFKISPDNHAWLLNLEGSSLTEISVSFENDLWTIGNSYFKLTGTFSNNGMSFITSEVFAAGNGGWMPDYSGTDKLELKMEIDKIAVDNTYIYFTNGMDELNALAVNKTQVTYSAPKTNIKGTPVIGFAPACFSDNINLTSVDFIPASFAKIEGNCFNGCSGLTSIVIPDYISYIGNYAFGGCYSLTSITFNGTVEQWNAITKNDAWNSGVPATHVHCIDDDVEI